MILSKELRNQIREKLPRNYSNIIAHKLDLSASTVRVAMMNGTNNIKLVNALIDLAAKTERDQTKILKKLDRLKIEEQK